MAKYMTWQLIAPPATRFYQQADGNFSMYFERERVDEMIVWAEQQLEAFHRLKVFIGMQSAAEQEKEVADANKKNELAARASNVSPKAPQGHIPNIRTREALEKNEAARKVVPKGATQPRQVVAGNPVTTQDEVKAAVPILEKPIVKPNLDLLKDPGMRIALEQQRALDERNGVNREAKNEAQDEQDEQVEEALHPEDDAEPAPNLEDLPPAPETERGANVGTQPPVAPAEDSLY